jgi:hypothetical protein
MATFGRPRHNLAPDEARSQAEPNVLGEARQWDLTGDSASAASTEREPDRHDLAAHYAAGGYASVGRRKTAKPSGPLVAATRAAWVSYLKDSLANGYEPEEILDEMRASGSTEQDGDALMREVVGGIYKTIYRDLLLGAVFVVAVVGITLMTQDFLLLLHLLAGAGGLFVLRAVWRWLQAPQY